eukprot:jgi/Mesvir1/4528/Mv25707-RA.1
MAKTTVSNLKGLKQRSSQRPIIDAICPFVFVKLPFDGKGMPFTQALDANGTSPTRCNLGQLGMPPWQLVNVSWPRLMCSSSPSIRLRSAVWAMIQPLFLSMRHRDGSLLALQRCPSWHHPCQHLQLPGVHHSRQESRLPTGVHPSCQNRLPSVLHSHRNCQLPSMPARIEKHSWILRTQRRNPSLQKSLNQKTHLVAWATTSWARARVARARAWAALARRMQTWACLACRA